MLHKIQKISKLCLIGFSILLLLIPLLIFVQWFCDDWSAIHHYMSYFGFDNPVNSQGLNIYSLPLLQQFIGFLGTLLSVSAWLIILVLLRKIFKNYIIANIFCTANAKYYQFIGYMFLLDSLITRPISGALLSIAATLSNPIGHRVITLSITNINLQSLFCGIILIIISRVMYLASQIQEEQQLTI